MRKFFRIAAAALIVLSAAGGAWGLSGKGHTAQWNQVLGIAEDDYESRRALEPLWSEMQKNIDLYDDNDDYTLLVGRTKHPKPKREESEEERQKRLAEERAKDRTDEDRYTAYCVSRINEGIMRKKPEEEKPFKWFSWGGYTHRLMFHWGFNTSPRDYSKLNNQVNEGIENLTRKLTDRGVDSAKAREFAENQKSAFYEYVRQLNDRRKDAMRSEAVRVTGLPFNNASALVSILYDVHLLDDYKTANPSALPSILEIERDIIERGFEPLLDYDNFDLTDKIDEDLKVAFGMGYGDDKETADNMIAVIEKYLPAVLNEKFGRELLESGITVVVPAAEKNSIWRF